MKTYYNTLRSFSGIALMLAFLAFFISPQTTFASHCTGLNDSGEGYISAVCLGNNQYEITVRWGNGSFPNVGSGVRFRLLGGATFASAPGELNAPNPGPGSPMAMTGGAIGTNMVIYGVLNGAGPRYSAINCEYTMVTFTTNGWPSQIQSSGDWNGCCTSTARNYPVCSPCDEDCDGVGDGCDVCPGGDDTIDNDGIDGPDCATYPGDDNLDPSWECGKNGKKVLMCHVPEDNPDNKHTICVSKNAVPDHMSHGDMVGPCIACEEEARRVKHSVEKTNDQSPQDYSQGITMSPNPTNGVFNISLDGLSEGIANISIYNQMGMNVWQKQLDCSTQSSLMVNSSNQMSNGLYIVAIKHKGHVYTKRLIVQN